MEEALEGSGAYGRGRGRRGKVSQKTESWGENHNQDYTMMIYAVNIYKALVIARSAPHALFHSFTTAGSME